jgi:hypothetical protein
MHIRNTRCIEKYCEYYFLYSDKKSYLKTITAQMYLRYLLAVVGKGSGAGSARSDSYEVRNFRLILVQIQLFS